MSADNWRDCPKCGAKDKAREDYEIYSEDDKVYIDYSIYCRECHYEYKFEESKHLLGLGE
jgi:ubiquitin C-terminal hydrolase